MSNVVSQALRDTWNYLSWNKVFSSQEVKPVTLGEIIVDLSPTVSETFLSRVLLEVHGPQRETLFPHIQLIHHGPLSNDRAIFVAKILAGDIPTENEEQSAAREHLISTFSEYLEMRDLFWKEGVEKAAARGSRFVISVQQHKEIGMRHKARSDAAMGCLMEAWGHSYNPSTQEVFPSYSILHIPYGSLTPLEHLEKERRDHERSMIKNLAQLLRDGWDPKKPTEEDLQETSSKNITFEVIKEKSAQEKRKQALPALKGAYSGLELVILSGLGKKILRDEGLQSALGEQLPHLTWGSLLDFANLAKDYNVEWALAAMDWEK